MYKRIITLFTLMWMAVAVSIAANKPFVVVIDAGHGGRDTGCVGAISKEKDLTLKMALAIGKFIEQNCSDVKVIYTRKTDVFLELWQRAEIANRNKADLFISVHINALPGGKIARGFQTYTLGRGRVSGSKKGISENLDVAKRENSVIVMEKDYKQHYEGFDPNSPESNIMFEFIQDTYMERSVQLAKFMQQHVCAATGRANGGAHQDNLAVLRLSSMPGCLLELGFISTKDEEQFLNSKDAPQKYARGVFNAFTAYKKKYHGGAASTPFAEAPAQEASLAPQQAEPRKQQTTKNQPEQKEKAAKAERKQETASQEVAKPEATKPEATKPETAKQETAKPDIADTMDEPVFKVQITTSDRKLSSGNSRLKGVEDADSYFENGLYKYTVGSSTNYNEIYQLRKTLLGKFPDAFIIAFKNGQKMNVQEAIREFKSNKNKK